MKFLVTDECQRLARWLRLCGYDTAMTSAQPLSELYRRAYNERRAVVTRNRRVKAGCLFQVIHLESTHLEKQLRQLVHERVLTIDEAAMLTRCDLCNAQLEPIEKFKAEHRVPPYVFQTQEAFRVCRSCERIYWTATHWQRVKRFLARIEEHA